jgi:hypothetical protein
VKFLELVAFLLHYRLRSFLGFHHRKPLLLHLLQVSFFDFLVAVSRISSIFGFEIVDDASPVSADFVDVIAHALAAASEGDDNVDTVCVGVVKSTC